MAPPQGVLSLKTCIGKYLKNVLPQNTWLRCMKFSMKYCVHKQLSSTFVQMVAPESKTVSGQGGLGLKIKYT